MREVLGQESRAAGITRSELEDRFLGFLAERDLPLPVPNAWLHLGEDWIDGDCVWPAQRLVVELDSWKHHGTKAAFRRDRARDRRLKVAGWEPIRVTSWDLDGEAERLPVELLALTSARRATP